MMHAQHIGPIEAQIRAAAEARRQRLFSVHTGSPAPETHEPIMLPQPKPRPATRPQKRAVVVPWPKPYWMAMDCHFNQHVVDYLHWRLAEENGIDVDATRRRSMLEITVEVLKDYPGIHLADLKGDRRTREVVVPRQVAMRRIYEERGDISLPEIGRYFGGRDHTTVLHAVRKFGTLNRPKVPSPGDHAETIRVLWEDGMSHEAIGKEVGFGQSAISRFISTQGWQRP